MDKERDSSLTADSPWRRGLLLLISLLAAQGDAGDLEELRQRDLSMEDLQRALHPYLLRSLRQAAEAMALAIGAVTADTLRFAEPSWPSSELHGTHAVLRRLDRVWPGPDQLGCLARTDAGVAGRIPRPGAGVARLRPVRPPHRGRAREPGIGSRLRAVGAHRQPGVAAARAGAGVTRRRRGRGLCGFAPGQRMPSPRPLGRVPPAGRRLRAR